MSNRTLTCILVGGLTNQEKEVKECLQIALLLDRALVLPHPLVRTASTYAKPKLPGDEQTSAVSAAAAGDFSELWSAAAFAECARTNYHGLRVLLTDDELPSQLVATFGFATSGRLATARWTKPHGAIISGSGIECRNTTAEGTTAECTVSQRALTNAATLRRFLPDSAQHVSLIAPFNIFWPKQSCLSPSNEMAAQADLLLARLPRDFDCLHLRAEEDW